MKKLSVPFALLVVLVWSACSGNKQQQNIADSSVTKTTVIEVKSKDTLTYTVKKINERADDCAKNKAEEECSYANIQYPVFNGRQKLNDSISKKLIGLCSFRDDKITNIDSLGKNFISSYYKSKKEYPDDSQLFTLDAYAKVIHQSAETITLELAAGIYSGGAHGNDQTRFINWDKKRDQSISLSDILIPGYQKQLTKAAEKIFRENENLSPSAPLQDFGLITNGKLALNNNFYISHEGIGFFYNEYDIKPYSEGTSNLLIPYSSIKHLLRPNTVISQYIK